MLPFDFKIYQSNSYRDSCHAIKTMIIRGAGAIGAAAGFAMAQAFLESEDTSFAEHAKREIEATRPTAQNLFYATNRVFAAAEQSSHPRNAAVAEAQAIAAEDAASCKRIGELGASLIPQTCNIQTHCNAGWLAFVDYGTALSPIYQAQAQGKDVFVYVDETRPRGQGARLTAWELYHQRIKHVIVPDNAGAYLMSQGKVDIMIVGADRIARNGDVANKIGTLEKAIVAHAYGIPFYVAAPRSTIDEKCASGEDIIIEERSPDEVRYSSGITAMGVPMTICTCSPGSAALNPAFDVTPAKYITGIITEKGIYTPDQLFGSR